jgi:class 3 adenylate cyclase/CHASE2 domain-containing sensor protein
VTLKPFKRVPVLIALGVILLACFVRWQSFSFLEHIERMTYDMRAREALKFSPAVATNLGFVFVDEEAVKAVGNGSLGYTFGLLWPRQVYGRVVQELTEQGARAIALDVVFSELRRDHAPVQMADGRLVESDQFFALQARRGSNTIIAVHDSTVPEVLVTNAPISDVTVPDLFVTNALALGDITTEKDEDGILRRVKLFRNYRRWHWAFRQAAEEAELDLKDARVEPRQIVLTNQAQEFKVPLDEHGDFDLADFGGENLPAGVPRKAKPFVDERVWHMGIVLAALELKLDLDKTVVDLKGGQVVFHGPNIQRTVAVDGQGYAYVDWSLTVENPALTKESMLDLLQQNRLRLQGQPVASERWRNRLAVIGSSAVTGNNLTDRGATPLSKDTLLVSKHWNVANSLLMDRFVRRSPFMMDIGLIVLLGVVSAIFTWTFRVLRASGLIALMMAGYAIAGVVVYVKFRLWVPLVLPMGGAILMTHVCMVTWRVLVEQAERRRIKGIFSKMVSPKIVRELVDAETLPTLGGARREVTVLFADVRGFTELTDTAQQRVEDYVREHGLSGAEAAAWADEQARETLDTVNLYLGLVADTLIQHDGTWDKFIGDCVMAFWGAPSANPKHAMACVRAAVAVQRAIHELNQQRAKENQRREQENAARVGSGLAAKPPLALLMLGSGINTGMATVGLMGSKGAVEQQNYTVFGREVNLASRLESDSGRGRIFIGGMTYEHLLRDDPELAATCVELPPRELKGFRTAVRAYEVPWKNAERGTAERVM